MNLKVESELRKIWDRIPKMPSLKDETFSLDVHKRLLDVFQVGPYYYFILNVRKSQIEVMSEGFTEVMGYPSFVDFDFFINLIHPEDQARLLNFETVTEKFFASLPPDKLFKYKVQYDYRIKKASGQYIRVLNQLLVIQHDAENVCTFVVNTDISHLKQDDTPRMSFLGLDGEPSFYNVDPENIFKPTQQMFTRREKDILKAMASGLSSYQIASELSISKLTVDSHRKNMLRKANAKSAGEIIRLAYDNGWI
jgi:DNA-binding CsgD family transcriptional regulator